MPNLLASSAELAHPHPARYMEEPDRLTDGRRLDAEIVTSTLSLLHLRFDISAWSRARVVAEIGSLVTRHGGGIDPTATDGILVVTRSAQAAFRLALSIMECSPLLRLQIGMHTGSYSIVHIPDGLDNGNVIVLRPDPSIAARLGRVAVPGAIAICATSYGCLAPGLEAELGAAIISREYRGDELSLATVTLPPHETTAQSSFAGLGRM